MERKNFTVIFVPHARAKFRKFNVTNYHLWGAVAVALVFVVGSAAIAWSHFTNPIEEEQVTRLRTENAELRAVNSSFEESIHELTGKLTEYEERTRQLAIVAGLEEVGGESGLGGPDLGMPVEESAAIALLEERFAGLEEELGEVEDRFRERFRWIASVPAISPTRGLFTSGFGSREDPLTGRNALHQGLDISASPGKPVVATADGIVVKAGRLGRLGNAVYISHGFGLTTRYGHMSKIDVRAGDRVSRGDVIGSVGNSGRSTGYHLHYEVREDGRPVNPLAYILDRGPRG